jgi:osmoprotectant transport system substrate-binding protein
MPPRLRLIVRLLVPLAALAALAGCGSSRSSPPPAAASTTATTATTGSATTATASTTTSTTTTSSLPGTGKPPVTIGDKNYTEQFVLGELYYEALKAEGFSVTLNQSIGPNQVRLQQLHDGLFMYPEYLNVWNSQIAGDERRFTSLHGAYTAAENFALGHGLELLDPTPFSDTAGIGVTFAYARQNQLSTIASLAPEASDLTLGGPPGPEFQQAQSAGLPALEESYGFAPATYKAIVIGDQYKALDQGTVQAAYVNTTDGQFTTGNYVLLKDPRYAFGIGNVVPVMSAKTLDAEGPAFADTIDRVSSLLTLPVIRELNALVDLAGETPAGVASRFLADHGVIPPSMVITS